MTENILVTGATGKVGRHLTRALVDAGASVVAGTHNPARARDRFGDSVEVVELNYELAETYDGALHWADRVFVTPAPFDPDAYTTLIPFVDWAIQAGAHHVVLLSAMMADQVEDLALRKVEKHIEATGVDSTVLRPNWYMQNFTQGYLLESIRDTGEFRMSAGDGAVSFVDVRDVAEVAARVLTDDRHFGHAYVLTGPKALTHHEAARLISEAAEREVVYRPMQDDAMRRVLIDERGRPPAQADVIVHLFQSMRDGWRSPISNDVEKLLGRGPRSFEHFAEENGAQWRVDSEE